MGKDVQDPVPVFSLAQKSSGKDARNRPRPAACAGGSGPQQGRAGRGRGGGSREAWWVQTSTRMQEEKGETWVDVGMTAQDNLYHGKPSHNCGPADATR